MLVIKACNFIILAILPKHVSSINISKSLYLPKINIKTKLFQIFRHHFNKAPPNLIKNEASPKKRKRNLILCLTRSYAYFLPIFCDLDQKATPLSRKHWSFFLIGQIAFPHRFKLRLRYEGPMFNCWLIRHSRFRCLRWLTKYYELLRSVEVCFLIVLWVLWEVWVVSSVFKRFLKQIRIFSC